MARLRIPQEQQQAGSLWRAIAYRRAQQHNIGAPKRLENYRF
jgi:hypothetical protein